MNYKQSLIIKFKNKAVFIIQDYMLNRQLNLIVDFYIVLVQIIWCKIFIPSINFFMNYASMKHISLITET